jgi:hypothetical protein
MAKAIFHKSQRVFVKPIGTWAHVEQVIPQWAQGIEEPIRVHYDVGMGKKFSADELESEGSNDARAVTLDGEWRVIRGQNKWRNADDCPHHPYPGTHPLVVTSDRDWGGWRVPGAEYNRDPFKVEQQAMLMAKVPAFTGILIELVKQADELEDDIPAGILDLARRAHEQLSEAGICATDESYAAIGTNELAGPAPEQQNIEIAEPAHVPEAAVIEAAVIEAAPVEPALEKLQPVASAEPLPTVPAAPTPAIERPVVQGVFNEEPAQHFGQRARPVAQPVAQEMRAAGANYQRPD